jgi:predicted nucleic acid-binding protein
MTVRTFLDANVFIAAADSGERGHQESLRVLFSPGRVLIATRLVRIEVQPPPRTRDRELQRQTRDTYLSFVDEWLPIDDALAAEAELLREQTPGLSPMDSLHAAAAIRAGAELVTLEAVTKPLYAVPGLRVVHVSAGRKSR